MISSQSPAQWVRLDTGLKVERVYAIAVSGSNLFAGTASGAFVSTNNGTIWNSINSGMTKGTVHALAVSGVNLFAGAESRDQNGNVVGSVYRSTDDGKMWTEVRSGGSVNALAVSGINLFAVLYLEGVFLSTNYGTSWIASNTGIGVLPILHTLAVSPAINGTSPNLYLGTLVGAYLSTNSGASWTKFNDGWTFPDNVYSFAFSGPSVFAGTGGLAGGIFRSTNGSAWTPAYTGVPKALNIGALAVSGSSLFAGSDRGIYISADLGKSWTPAGLMGSLVHALVKAYVRALLPGNAGVHFHSLRSTFATWLVQKSVSIYEVQKLLGHSSIAVTQIYSHLAPNELHNTVNKIGVVL